MNYWLIFLTGLTSGGVTCAAMQGGLLASIIAGQKKEKSVAGFGFDDYGPVVAFLTTKLIAHIILGALLGLLGSAITLSLGTRLFFQTLAALFMFAAAMNLLDVHPIFRYLVIKPPKFAYKFIKNTGRGESMYSPALFGLLTLLIPCGVTQAMEVVAISSGNMLSGALTMGVFILGTAPMFALIGIATSRLSETSRVYFFRTAAILLIAMSLYSINGVLKVIDSPYEIGRIISVIRTPTGGSPTTAVTDGVQKVTVSISNGGYTPKRFVVRNNVPVELTLEAGAGVYSCATAFTFKAFQINDNIKPGEPKIHVFTPTKKGIYTFACSMGMYSSTMEVI